VLVLPSSGAALCYRERKKEKTMTTKKEKKEQTEKKLRNKSFAFSIFIIF
jgi:hypothetical protein